MMLPEHSSEFERMCACGRSVCTTTFGLRGSETSTPVKFFGALSCASQMMRRPSLAMVTAMPSPMPPKPPRLFWASSLKFQVTGSPLWVSGLFAADIRVSGAWRVRGKGRRGTAPAGVLLHTARAVITCERIASPRSRDVPLSGTAARNQADSAFFMKSLRKHLLQSGIFLILCAFISTSAWCVM